MTNLQFTKRKTATQHQTRAINAIQLPTPNPYRANAAAAAIHKVGALIA